MNGKKSINIKDLLPIHGEIIIPLLIISYLLFFVLLPKSILLAMIAPSFSILLCTYFSSIYLLDGVNGFLYFFLKILFTITAHSPIIYLCIRIICRDDGV